MGPASPRTDDIDTSLGTVHMVLGGGGASDTTNGVLLIRMHITSYNVDIPRGDLSVFENFTLHRKRSDGPR